MSHFPWYPGMPDAIRRQIDPEFRRQEQRRLNRERYLHRLQPLVEQALALAGQADGCAALVQAADHWRRQGDLLQQLQRWHPADSDQLPAHRWLPPYQALLQIAAGHGSDPVAAQAGLIVLLVYSAAAARPDLQTAGRGLLDETAECLRGEYARCCRLVRELGERLCVAPPSSPPSLPAEP